MKQVLLIPCLTALFGCLAVSPARSPALAPSVALTSAARVQPTIAAGAGSEATQPLGVPGSWRLRFDDEFSGRRLDLHRWQPNWLGASPDTVTPPVTRFDLNCVAPAASTESDGRLTLTATVRGCSAGAGRAYRYVSALINTRSTFHFRYGFLEARIYVPAGADGRPVDFPAFWANGLGHWPSSGELDVMETLRGCGPGPAYHFHSSGLSAGGCAPAADAVGWHTYGALWEPGVVSFYYDGQPVGSVSGAVTSDPMYLVLDNSVDPVYGGQSAAARMLVDYVRVWQ